MKLFFPYKVEQAKGIPPLTLFLRKSSYLKESEPLRIMFFETLSKSSRYVIAYGLISAKKPETRQRRFEKFIALLVNEKKP